jgi:transcriptional regulator with XRE-family HTH domain
VGNQFGSTIKKLRQAKHLLQRQVASQLEMDTPMLSKIERGERKAKKEQVARFATILKADKEELLTLWLADLITDIIQDEALALKAMQVAEEEVKYNLTKK